MNAIRYLMILKASNDFKIFLCFGSLLTLITIPGILIEFFIKAIRGTVMKVSKLSGDEPLSYLSSWANLAFTPVSEFSAWFSLSTLSLTLALMVIFMVYYQKQRCKIFMVMLLSFFVAYFVFFLFLAYPNIDIIQEFQYNTLQGIEQPRNILLSILSTLGSSSEFIMVCMWWDEGVLLAFFWILANQSISTHQAKWMYPSFMLFYGLGWFFGKAIIVGAFPELNNIEPAISEFSLAILLMILVMLIPVSIILIKKIESLQVKSVTVTAVGQPFSLQFRSLYLLAIFMVIISYEVCTKYLHDLTNFISIGWFEPNTNYFIVKYYCMTITFLVVVLGTFWLLKWKGWRFCSLLLPAVIISLGATYAALLFILGNGMWTVWYDSLSNAVIYGTTWTLFIAVKEMAYISLPVSTKARAKIFIELVIPVSYITKFFVGNPYAERGTYLWSWAAPIQIIIICMFAFIWLVAIRKLGKYYKMIESPSV